MIRPMNDQVVIKRDPPQTTYASGLIIPDAHVDFRSTAGTVLAVGPKCNEVKIGDRVLLHIYGGVEHRVDGDLVGLWKEDDIFGVIEPEMELIDA